MKFSRLSLSELESLEKEFIEFLAANGIDSDYWIKLKKEKNEKAEKLIDVFSDIVWQKSLDKINFLEHRTATSLKLFKCDKETIELIGIDGDIEKFNPNSNSSNKYSIYHHKKEYAPSRDMELYRMVKTGCSISNETLFNSIKKLL